jgi:predicted nucleotidyltransferase
MTSIPDVGALRLARALDRACARTLGCCQTSAILHGSAVLGDYVAGASDIDILLVVARALTDDETTAVAASVVAERDAATGAVDVRIVTRAVSQEPPRLPPLEAYIRVGPGGANDIEVERHVTDPDVLVELSVCRQRGVAVSGLPVEEVVGVVPDEWVVEVGDAQLARWQAIGDDPPHAQLTVLTACRVWRFAEEGEHVSKRAAADWALARDPTLPAVRSALRQREDVSADIDAAEVEQLLSVVRERVESTRPWAAGGRY